MSTAPAVQSIRINNLLSFSSDTPDLALRPLNVFIGTNGSGKSNLLEIFALLQSTSFDLPQPIREGGGIVEWLWKGGGSKNPLASIDVLVRPERGNMPLHYRLAFTRVSYNMEITEELIENEKPFGTHANPLLYFHNQNGRAMINIREETRQLRREDIDPRQSILSQRKDPDQYPEITYLGKLFAKFAFYRDWEFGINAEAREIHAPDEQSDYLEEDTSNLGLMLNRLRLEPAVKPKLLEYLRQFYSETEDIHTQIREGLVEMRLEEKSGFTTPARRLSDGTLRWLSLLAVFLNPDPPPLVCIEEPELGLHPDVIHVLAKLIKEASARMQVIITTHSSALIEEFSDEPGSVVVCEKNHGASTLRRLEQPELSEWLGKYTLGELWRKGELGGNRW
jgi:predicted ATPase